MNTAMESLPGEWVDDLVGLYREQYRPLVKLASLLLDDVATCEEVVQDAFVAVHRRRVDDPAKLPAYLRSAVLNGARSHLRRQKVRRAPRPNRPLVVVPPADVAAVVTDERAAVLAALRALPDRQRDVLVLRYWMELSDREIADSVGIGVGTVKTHVRRGLDALARALEDRR
jgi:RNA polymerase sigma-70 factor (sigma-E family)